MGTRPIPGVRRVVLVGLMASGKSTVGRALAGQLGWPYRDNDELLAAVVVPAPARGEGRGYEKAKFRERPAVSVGVSVRVVKGAIADATVSVGSMVEIGRAHV